MADPKKPVDTQAEIEHQVGELEERVDRLRAMYEQYFMGYEKLEPTVARRDVDRRFATLRKANIRNTALRWRFNVVTQKFNTYSMYWTRICRQIEEGTFKRHVARAAKRFGPNSRRNADEFSIDVDLEDFEVDMDDFETVGDAFDALLAEAEGYAEKPRHASEPSEPPPRSIPNPRPAIRMQRDEALTDRPAAATDRPTAPPAGFMGFDGNQGSDTLPPGSVPPASVPGHRVARHAVLPTGMKQRVLVKKQPGVTPRSSSSDAAPDSAPTPTPQPAPAGHRPPMPSVPEQNVPSTSVIRAAAPQGGHVHRSPPGVVRPPISPAAGSVGRVPIAKPAPSVQRVPAAGAHPAPSAQRIPAAAPNPALGRPPAATPNAGPASTPRVPVPSAGRVPVGLPSSVARVPAASPSSSEAKTAPPPPSDRKIPAAPPSQRAPMARSGGPMPAAPPSRPSSPPESERSPVPSRRPPPPLPSQLKKP